MENTMIKKVRFDVFDVFFGKGWQDWVRMEYKNGTWNHILGDKRFESGAAVLLKRKLNTGTKE